VKSCQVYRPHDTNANRAETYDLITPDNFRPNPKNPIIASFFRNIGLADELGSGVRKIFRYSKLYSGKEPQMIDGDVFQIIGPLGKHRSIHCTPSCGQFAPAPPAQTPALLQVVPAFTQTDLKQIDPQSVAQAILRHFLSFRSHVSKYPASSTSF